MAAKTPITPRTRPRRANKVWFRPFRCAIAPAAIAHSIQTTKPTPASPEDTPTNPPSILYLQAQKARRKRRLATHWLTDDRFWEVPIQGERRWLVANRDPDQQIPNLA
jgi:hypothetical protein